MEAIKSDDSAKLIIGKRYLILDMDPAALGPGVAKFDYLVEDETSRYVWVNEEYLKEFAVL